MEAAFTQDYQDWPVRTKLAALRGQPPINIENLGMGN
jgi:hypothetical protein